MTHSLHREGTPADLCEDYPMLAIRAKGYNEAGNAWRMQKILELASRYPIVNFGDIKSGSKFTTSIEHILKSDMDPPLVHMVFTNKEDVVRYMQDLKEADLGISVVASGLFGDGAAAVVMSGGARPGPGPRVVATRSVFYPDTERVMGWDVVDSGFKVVLSAQVPAIVRGHIREDVDAFLRDNGLARSDVRHWIAHTGGPKVLEAFEGALELPEGALARSWRSLRDVGNLSSASVLFVLGDLLDGAEARPGDLGLMVAMGPGFCSEIVLLAW